MAKRLSLKLDNQAYQLGGETLRIPTKPRHFVTLKLKIGEYQRRFLRDSSLRLGSITLTESKLIVAFKKAELRQFNCRSVVAYDTNELSLDGALSNGVEVRPVHVHLRQVARIRAFHFERRRHMHAGIALSYVPAKDTSRTCPRCGCLQTGHRGEQDPKSWQVFQCPKCGWTCDRHLNAALNLLKTQDEGRWFSPDRLPNEVMTAKRAYGQEDSSSPEELSEPRSNSFKLQGPLLQRLL